MNFKEVESEVLICLAPTKSQEKDLNKIAQAFIQALSKNLKDANVTLGGSVAKGTFLANKTDVDVFVQFNFEKFANQSDKLSDVLEPVLKKSFPIQKIKRVHGSRDYFQVNYADFIFEIVPILEISDSLAAVNITDISPLHTAWINKQPKSIKNQIRLTKQFAKAQGAYGAESYIGGFSGYVLEILTIYYGSFQNLIEASQKWKKKQVVDVENLLKCKDVFMEIDIAKLNSPIIVVDPTDKYRNAAAALSEERFKRFKLAAKNYLNAPNSSFFEIPVMSLDSAKKIAISKKRNLIYFELSPLNGKRDVVGSKLLKVFDYLKTELRGFNLRESDWSWEGSNSPAKFYICTSKKQLPKEEVKKGPPTNMSEAVTAFKKKNSKFEIFEEKGNLFAKVPIKVRDLESVTKKILSHKYVTEKIKKVKVLEFSVR